MSEQYVAYDTYNCERWFAETLTANLRVCGWFPECRALLHNFVSF